MSKGSYSVKYVAAMIMRYRMKAQIFRVGRSGAVLFCDEPFYRCSLPYIESNVFSYSYVKRFIHDLDVKSIMIDVFTRSDFMIQVKYFKFFFNRAS